MSLRAPILFLSLVLLLALDSTVGHSCRESCGRAHASGGECALRCDTGLREARESHISDVVLETGPTGRADLLPERCMNTFLTISESGGYGGGYDPTGQLQKILINP